MIIIETIGIYFLAGLILGPIVTWLWGYGNRQEISQD